MNSELSNASELTASHVLVSFYLCWYVIQWWHIKKRLYQGHDSKIFGHLEICFVFFVVFLNVLCVYILGLNDWFNVLI